MSKFSWFFFFGNPTNKTVTGTAFIYVGTINSKPPGAIIIINQWEHWVAVRSNFVHSSLEVHNYVAAPFTSHGKLHYFGVEKPCWAKPAHFDFFTINFTVWCHIGYTTTISFFWQNFAKKWNLIMKWFWRFLNLTSHVNKKMIIRFFYIWFQVCSQKCTRMIKNVYFMSGLWPAIFG